jgi:hypothetical protein
MLFIIMSSRNGRQKQMMNVVPPVIPAQTLQRQQPIQRQQPPQTIQRQQPIQRQPPQPQEKQQKPKMTIGDAIGLITIRLGRVEQFIQQLQTDGIDMNLINSAQSNDLMDNGLIQNLVSRLNTLEESSSNTATEQRIKNIETDLKDTKDLLIKLMLKFEIFTDNTLAKFEEQQQQIAFNLEQELQEPMKDLSQEEQYTQEEEDEALPSPSNESEPVP